ncbi:MAG: SDR family oxidoreductase [Methanoregula sp.]|jgi:NAD(P)-dependent dehydrogenase (short-subunit alcohol dehydrogenase family)
MNQPIILVTGSTDGIGKATARELASRGAEVILHGRNNRKGNEVRKEMADTTGTGMPDLLVADLSSQDQIRQMAEDIISRYTRLDVLINNAGTFEKKRRLTESGVEMTFAINYLAPFLLTRLLLPLINKSAPSRIVTLASSAHEDVDHIDWDNLPAQDHYDSWGAYALSKFADITFTYTLARQTEGSGVVANCLHPGVTDTKILRSAFPGYPAISPEEGAQTSVYLAISPEVTGISGQYFDNRKKVRSSALTHDRSVQDRLWNLAEDLMKTG